MEQMKFDIPKDKKAKRVTFVIDRADKKALEDGMRKVGETNISSYIRRLIHQNK